MTTVIDGIIDRNEQLADRGKPPSEYTQHNNLLRAMSALEAQLTRIADALETLANNSSFSLNK